MSHRLPMIFIFLLALGMPLTLKAAPLELWDLGGQISPSGKVTFDPLFKMPADNAELAAMYAIDVTAGTLPALGVHPALGRWFTEKDDSPGSPATAILTYGYWMRKFGGDASVLGRRIVADGEAKEIIGVKVQ